MKPDELRALADALEPMAKAPRFEDFDVPAFCAWVRAQADAQPVAPIALVRAFNSGYMQGHHDTVEAQFIDIHPLDMDTYHADVVAELGLTAAPQAEPCIGNDSACPCQDGDACHYRDAADGTKGWPVPQAEPKREPLPGLTPTHRCPACGALWRQCDDASWNLRSTSCCGLCDAGRVELVRWLDEPKREPLSDERITKGEYVLATKWGDGDPGDHWGVGFYDRFENGRHYVVDRAGQQIRGCGFRRAGRITMEVGIWLLSAAKSLEASPPGTVNLWTMLTERAHGIGGSDE